MVDIFTMKEIDEIDLGGGYIYHLSMTRSGNGVMAGCGDSTGRVYDLITKKITTFTGHTDLVRCIISGHGTDVITCSDDKTIRIWDGPSGVCKKKLTGHTGDVRSILYEEKSKRIFSASNDKSIICWDYVTYKKVGVVNGHKNAVVSLSWVNATTIVSGSWDRTIKVWDITSGTCLKTLSENTEYVNSVAVTPDGDHIISESDGKAVKITSISTGVCIHTLSHHSFGVRKVAISPNGRFIGSGGLDHMFFLHEVSPPFPLLIHEGSLSSTTHKNKTFRLYSNGIIRIFNGISGSIITTITSSTICSLINNTQFEIQTNTDNKSNNNSNNNNNITTLTAPTPTSVQLWVEAINAVSNNLSLQYDLSSESHNRKSYHRES
jgi:WD40 repeat protein